MPKVVSSNVAEINYDQEKRELEVIFHSGASYTYGAVAPQTYLAMLKTDSPGSFVNRILKQHPVVQALPAGVKRKRK